MYWNTYRLSYSGHVIFKVAIKKDNEAYPHINGSMKKLATRAICAGHFASLYIIHRLEYMHIRDLYVYVYVDAFLVMYYYICTCSVLYSMSRRWLVLCYTRRLRQHGVICWSKGFQVGFGTEFCQDWRWAWNPERVQQKGKPNLSWKEPGES